MVVWREPLKELPAGIIVGSKDNPLTIGQLFQLLEQLARMGRFVTAQIEQSLSKHAEEKKAHGEPPPVDRPG